MSRKKLLTFKKKFFFLPVGGWSAKFIKEGEYKALNLRDYEKKKNKIEEPEDIEQNSKLQQIDQMQLKEPRTKMEAEGENSLEIEMEVNPFTAAFFKKKCRNFSEI